MSTFKINTLLATAVLAGSLQAAPGALAENVHLGKSVPTTAEVIDLLKPDATNRKVRGLRLQQPPPGGAEMNHASATEPQTQEPRSISLEVYFEFDSAVLSREAIEQLSPVGAALESEQLTALSFELVGHTDAVGEEDYNQILSERRAEAVKHFFIDQYRIDSDRLDTVGKGEAELLDAEHPAAGVNRRVTIVAH